MYEYASIFLYLFLDFTIKENYWTDVYAFFHNDEYFPERVLSSERGNLINPDPELSHFLRICRQNLFFVCILDR